MTERERSMIDAMEQFARSLQDMAFEINHHAESMKSAADDLECELEQLDKEKK